MHIIIHAYYGQYVFYRYDLQIIMELLRLGIIMIAFSFPYRVGTLEALLTVSTPVTYLNICNTEMYNHDNLSK